MDILHEFEIAIILWIQTLGDWLAGPLSAISLLGSEEFYLLIMPALYWSVDAALGFRTGLMLLLTNGFNTIFKLAFHYPRPYWINTDVRALSAETSFGMPSGHSQHSASIWGLVATSVTGKWSKAFFIVLIFLIGISRIFLGMHFISDVLAGWAIGWLLLLVFLKVEKPAWAWLRLRSLPQMLWLAVLSSIAIILLIVLTGTALGDWQVPQVWKDNALAASPKNEIDPLDLSGAFTIAGTWLGMTAGGAWMYHKHGGFSAEGTPAQRVLRYWVGLVGVFVLWYGLGAVFPRTADVVGFGLRLFRYTLIGLWVSVLAPLLFQRMNLVTLQKGPARLFAK